MSPTACSVRMSDLRRDLNDPMGVDVSITFSLCLTEFHITLALYINDSDGRGVRRKVSLEDRFDKLNWLCMDIGLLYLRILKVSLAQW